MAFELPPLPFAYDALEPHMSKKTLEFHHDKHHAAYVKTLNELVEDSPLEKESLEDLIRTTAKDQAKATIFNNAAQVWNHTFFWNCLKKGGGGKPSGDLAKRIDADLGGYDKFAAEFAKAATTEFGSGWAWLVLDKGKLQIIKTSDAVNPLSQGKIALLAIDVWEHAYYLDYQNKRPDFVKAFLEHLVNWDYAARNLQAGHALAH
jgi:superoxide dismutase, Fe-Mn family